MRVALFGGSFDPPHHGHIAIAAAAADVFDLEQVLFAPVGHQPLKTESAPAAFAYRLAMVELACAVDVRFSVSEVDAPRPDGSPNYTVRTLAALHEQMPEARLFNLVGADSFLDLPRWREPERLLELAEWIVVSRPGFALADLSPLCLTPLQRGRVHLLQTVHEDVAATNLRERLEKGDPCLDVLAPAVSEYIEAHHLYR
ncbi:MAG: nicotinate-nucleotide adenylyltransferase [Edaphobacter sp.]